MKTLRAKKKGEDEFPLVIQKGHAVVKIYRMKHRDGFTYAVTHRSATGRSKQSYKDLEIAKREANNTAHKLSVGDLEALKLTGRERHLYVAATEAILPTGLSLDRVAREFVRAFEILGRDSVVEAARFYKARTESTLPVLTVAEVVARFVQAKVGEKISVHYRKDLRFYLERGLAEHFHCNLTSVSSDDLRTYLNAKKCGLVAKNNHRRLIVALFNFAKGEGFLAANESTAADALGTYNVKPKDVTIYTPDELSRLLKGAEKEFVPWIALTAFGGLRHEELHKGLEWSAIDFEKGTLIVPAAIAKTGRKRKVAMAENLRAWLAPYQGKTGKIYAKDSDSPISKASAASGVAWKRNALRHSFGSYRMESVKNAGQVSLEMGNSASVVMKHYFEIVDAEEAEKYWAIAPTTCCEV